jgi:hypothetical protein
MRAEETLHRRVVPAVSLAAHRLGDVRRESRASSPVAAEFTGETDSAAEGKGFEPSVPLGREMLERSNKTISANGFL